MAAINGYFVLHASENDFRDTSMLEMMDRSEGKVESKKKFAELLDTEGAYHAVAFVHNVQGMDPVFELTNHIEQDWNRKLENKKFVVEINPAKQKRSTSVGDIIIDAKNEKVHLVSGVGFKELDPNTFDLKKLMDKTVKLGKEALDQKFEKYGIRDLEINR